MSEDRKLRTRYSDRSARLISILMNLANIVDEEGLNSENGDITITNRDLGLGYRALSGYLRDGISLINELQGQVYSLKETINFKVMELEESIDVEDLSDENKKKALNYVRKLRKQEGLTD